MTLSSSVRASLEEATATYEMFLPEADSYLNARGVGADLAATYRLGYVAVPQVGHDAYEGRLCIPYLTRAGVVNLKFRCIENHSCKDEGHGKYMGLPNAATNLYNAPAFFEDSTFIAITEGEIDALILDGACGIPAVGIPGAQNWKPHFERCFADYERVFIFADGDEPGKDFAKRLASVLDGVTVVQMPIGSDVNATYLNEGVDGIKRRAGM